MEIQSVQKLDGQGALAGIKASRLWTLELLWTCRGCPESGRLSCSGRFEASRVKQSDHCTPDAVVITPFFETSGIFSTTLVGQAWRRSVKS